MRRIILSCAVVVLLGMPAAALAQSRTDWEMHQGEGLVPFGFTAPTNGAVVEYDFAQIPAAGDPGWGPAPNADSIGYSRYSTLCGVLSCRRGGEFTYFQTFVDVPADVQVTQFTIAFSGIDDGARVTIFNSANPGGAVVPGSYVFLGGTGTADLANLVVSGEVNRVVVTHVDDCCNGSSLGSAAVVLNGAVVPQDPCPNDPLDDIDGDGLCADEDPCPYDPDNDADGDTICGDEDVCPGTVIPEDAVPSVRLGVNRWVLGEDGVFVTKDPNGRGPRRAYDIAGTAGCNCEQIIEALALGEGHSKFGCSISAMDEWTAEVAGTSELGSQTYGPTRLGEQAGEAPQVSGCRATGVDGSLWLGLMTALGLLLLGRRRQSLLD